VTAPSAARILPAPAWPDRRPPVTGLRHGRTPNAGEPAPAASPSSSGAVATPVPRVAAATMGRLPASLRRLARAAAALLTVLAAHAALAAHLAVLGVTPDLPLVAVVAVAAGCGARPGAAFGFAAGLGADLFLSTPLGTSALAYTLVGHVVGGAAGRLPTGVPARCSPGSMCFACRTGRRTAARPSERRRAAVRRGAVLAAAGVGAGRLAVALAAGIFGGVPFPGVAGLVRTAAVGLVSAPFGVPAVAAVRRLSGGAGAGARL